MSNFIANARVVIQADTSLFVSELKRAVDAAERRKIRVKVIPDTRGFTRDANAQLKQVNLAPVRVRVVADLTGFRTAVRTAALEAVKGLNIPVGVTAGQVTRGTQTGGRGGGVATGAVVDKRAASAQLALATATDAGIAARRKLNKELSASEKQLLRDVRVAAQLKTAQDAVNAAIKSGLPALQAEAEALLRVAVAANQANIARQARAVATDPATVARAAEAAAKAELDSAVQMGKTQSAAIKDNEKRERDMGKAHSAAIAENDKRDRESAAKFERLQAQRVKAIRAEIVALQDRARQVQLSTGVSGRTRTRDILGQPVRGGGTLIDDEAITRNEAYNQSLDATKRAETQLRAARLHAAVAGVQSDDITKKLASTKAAERAVTTALIERDEALAFARASGVDDIIRSAAAERQLTAERLKGAAAATAEVNAERVRAGRIGASRRALEAVSAQFAGLRGAALSAQGAFIATAAGAIALGKAVASAAAFESELNVFKVTAQATAEQMEAVRARAVELGRDITLPAVGAQDAAEAFTNLSKAGLSVNSSLAGARGVLQLATAAQIENAEATELAASALNAFGLGGFEAVRVADVLANAANASQGSIVDIGIALRQSAAVARQAGLTLEETTGVLTLFARSGLRGSDAGTSFRTGLIRLINPTAKAAAVINELGLEIRDTNGAIRLDVFQQFADATRDLTAAQRDQALAIIFGQDAIRGAAILAREGTRGLNDQIDALGRSGSAAELAGARMTGLTGSTEALKNQLASTGLIIGQALTPAVKVLVDSLTTTFRVINTIGGGLGELASDAAGLATTIQNATSVEIAGMKVGLTDLVGPVRLARLGFKGLNVAMDSIETQRTNLKLLTTRAEVKKLVEELNEVGGLSKLNEVVLRFQELRDELANGDANAQKLSKTLNAFIINLQNKSASTKLDPLELNIKVPGDLELEALGGAAGETTAKEFTRQYGDRLMPRINRIAGDAAKTFKHVFLTGVVMTPTELEQAFGISAGTNVDFGLGALFKSALDKAKAGFAAGATAAAAGIKKDRAKLESAATGANNKVAGLERAGIDLEIAGANDPALLKNANAKIAAQQKVVATEEKRRAQILEDGGKESNERLRAAKETLAGFVAERQSILDSIASDAEQAKSDAESARQKAQDARDKADQAFLDALAPRDQRLERQSARAAGTPGLEDDRKVLVAQRKRLLKKIELIREGLNDQKEADALIAALRLEVITTTNAINAKTAEIAAVAGGVLDKRVELARLTGDPIIGLLKQVVQRALRRLVAAKAAKQGVLDAKIAFRTAVAEMRDEQQEMADSLFDVLQQRIELAGLRGNEANQLKLIDKAIADRKREIARLKGLGKATLGVQLEIERLIDQREEIKKTAEKGSGTTAFDLLTQAADTFRRTGGNLIGGDQPFAGPTGFTADIAQWLQSQGGARTSASAALGPNAPTSNAIDRNDRAHFDRLVAALDRNTDAVSGKKGNGSTATRSGGPANDLLRNDKRYWEARSTRNATDADSTGLH